MEDGTMNLPSQTKDVVNERREGNHQLVYYLETLCGIIEREKKEDSEHRFLEKMRMYKKEGGG